MTVEDQARRLMYLGYNTNGWTNHRFEDCLAVLAEIGYHGVAITLDHHLLDPFDPQLHREIERVRGLLERYAFSSVVETGARYLLDPRHKHQPTLLSDSAPDRERRIDFLTRAVDIAAALRSDAVSFWSGTPLTALDDETALARLAEECRRVLDHAERKGVTVGFEPEPGMWVDTMKRFEALDERINHPLFQLTLDVGHVHCLEADPLPDVIHRWTPRIVNVHIEDMRKTAHEHLVFGEGQIAFGPAFDALRAGGYQGGVFIELPRHAHDAVRIARHSHDFLGRFM